MLQKTVEEGGEISEAQPHDVASLLKQFFRELPEPLLTNQLHDHFLKSLLLASKNEQTMAILLLCILLPIEHLYTLQYFVKFMSKVAEKSEESKMGTANLAIVLTPNLMNCTSKKENSNGSEKLLKEQTLVVQMLLENASKIGLVSEDILCEAKDSNINEGGLSSGDELDGEKVGLRGRSRPTSSSISGLFKTERVCMSDAISALGYLLPLNDTVVIAAFNQRFIFLSPFLILYTMKINLWNENKLSTST